MPNENQDPDNVKQPIVKSEIKTYKRRWFIVILFILIMIMNQIPVFQYTIIANLIIKYYNVSALAVDWTSIVSMASNIPMSVPSAYLIDRWGLRVAVLVGSVGTITGLMTNLLASSRDSFCYIMIGQTILAIAQVPLIIMIPRLAAVWFGPDEITRAAYISGLGNAFGAGLGFLLPSMFISNHDNVDDIGNDLIRFQWVMVGAAVPIVVAIFIYFPARPPLPPSPTQEEELHNKKEKSSKEFVISLKALFTNKGFIIHLLAFCINAGVYAGIVTFLNQIVLNYFPNSEKDVGRMGFCMVIFSTIGGLSFSYILDRAKRYKELTLGVIIMSFLGLVLYMFSLESNSKLILYLANGVLGLFTSAYGPIAIQFAIELTYPCPESTAVGVMSTMSQIFSVIYTHILALSLESLGTFKSLSIYAGFLLMAVIMTAFIPNDLRRQAVFKKYDEQNRGIRYSPAAVEEE